MGQILRLWLAIPPLLFLLSACEDTPPPGTVAEVNGERVGLHAAQALMDSRTGAMGIPPKPSVAKMRQSYAQAVSTLIAHTLVRQELASRGIGVAEDELDAAIGRIKADYGEAALEEFLADASVREDEWRQLVRDHLSLETFTRRVLDPTIRISRNEIRNWYKEHEDDFKKPETWQICLKGAASEEELETWCSGDMADLDKKKDAQCLSSLPADVPQPWQNELKKIAPGKCGKIIKQDNQWRTIAIIRREDARTAKISEVYALIESAIMAEKRQAAFEAWLREQLSHARVKAMPGLFGDGSHEDGKGADRESQ